MDMEAHLLLGPGDPKRIAPFFYPRADFILIEVLSRKLGFGTETEFSHLERDSLVLCLDQDYILRQVLERIDIPVAQKLVDTLEEQHESLRASVHIIRILQDFHPFVLHRVMGDFIGIAEHFYIIERLVDIFRYIRAPSPDNREYRTLDRLRDSLIGIVDRLLDGGGKVMHQHLGVLPDTAAQAVEELREDNPGVPARAVESGLRDRIHGLLERLLRRGVIDYKPYRRRHIRPRIRIGHGKHVNFIQIALVFHYFLRAG